MDPKTILWIVLAIITVDFVFNKFLDYLNLKVQKNKVPDEMQGFYDDDKYKKSQDYQRTNTRFSAITGTFSFILGVVFLYFGWLGDIDQWLRSFTNDPIILALYFFGLLFIAADIITIPFQWYGTFVIEEKFGFNKVTKKLFFIDKLKSYLLTILIGGGIIYLLLWLITVLGEDFWIYFWIAISIFILFINMFYTSLILPLFNKLTPLEDEALKVAIQEYSKRVNFPLSNIFVIDGSKRSTKSNAFFSGLGKKKKIVLYDTLIKNHSIEELVAVLAHEVGHYKKRHVIQGIAISFLQSGIMLYIMSLMIFNENLSLAIGGSTLAIHLNLLTFGILYSPISRITGVFMNLMSRKNEFEADEYAAKTYHGNALQLALKKLSVDNLSNLKPHPWYVFFNYSHPPVLERLRAIDNN